MYLTFSKVKRYFGKIDKSKCLTLVATNESKKKFKRHEKSCSKFTDVIRSVTKNSSDYGKNTVLVRVISNYTKDLDLKNLTYYFLNDILNIKKSDPNNIKIDKKSDKNIIIYYIEYVTVKDLKYVKINNVNPLYLSFSKVNGYFEEINKSKC